jgi:hypothetical protein
MSTKKTKSVARTFSNVSGVKVTKSSIRDLVRKLKANAEKKA